jgi:VWFA-related protein
MRAVTRHASPLVAFVLACAAALAEATPQQTQETPPGRIRVAVEVVAVDVQVLDRAGQPVPNLGPERFTVTINGRRRRVISAEQIGRDSPDGTTSGAGGGAASGIPSRVIMLAVDTISFDETASRDVIQSVGQFVRGLAPEDYVGLSAYPNGAQINPTTDHAAVLRALNTVVGQRDGPGLGQLRIRPTEVIDVSRDIASGGGPVLEAVVARECADDQGAGCRSRLINEVTNAALYYEGQSTASLGMLRTLIAQMQRYPGRKTLVLVSGGMIASDTPGGRPDLGSQEMHVGREAAIANTAIYTLFVDSTLHDQFAAETRSGARTLVNRSRDTQVLMRWLEQFTGAAGGALFNVQVGNAASALSRIHTELSSYYLLGVEPAEEDRDGRTHEVKVKVTQSNLTIRGRRWVLIPKRGVTDAPAAPAAAAPAPPDPAPRRVPDDVAALADAFERSTSEAFQKGLGESRGLGQAIRGFRQGDSPWPDDRRRTAIFALELGLAGLRSSIRDVREEGGRLLAEYHVRVREPAGADAFECWWLVTEAAALAGLFNPENAQQFIPRSLQRCPDNARLNLAYAVVSEQQWLRGFTTAAHETEVVSRYETAMKFPETGAEARIRAARFLSGLGQFDRALAMLDGMAAVPSDLELRYFAHLVRGQVLRSLGRFDAAAASFGAALTAWPGAQSAQVALMTLQTHRGNREEAAALAEAVQTAPPDQYDPWWMYWLGDYRVYPAINARLRELGQ